MGKKNKENEDNDDANRKLLDEAERKAREVKPVPKPEPTPNRDDPGMEIPG